MLSKIHTLPFTRDDCFTDFLGRLTRCCHMLGKENFLETDGSPSAVVRSPTVEKAAVPEPFAKAIARLLREDVGNLVRDLISS